jgi:hypothetical protein
MRMLAIAEAGRGCQGGRVNLFADNLEDLGA